MHMLNLSKEQFDVLKDIVDTDEGYEERIKERMIDDLRNLTIDNDVADYRAVIDEADKSMQAYNELEMILNGSRDL